MNPRLRRPAGVLLAGVLVSSAFALAPAQAAGLAFATGTVTGEGVGPIHAYITAYVFDEVENAWVTDHFVQTDPANGNYSMPATAGDYVLGFEDATSAWDDEFYNNVGDIEDATPLTFVEGAPIPNINAELAVGSQIAGHVTNLADDPLDVEVTAYSIVEQDGEMVWDVEDRTDTDAAGDYAFNGIPAGTYRVGFESNTNDYAYEYYPDQAALVGATSVVVDETGNPQIVDAQLAAPSMITGTVTDVNDDPMEFVDVRVFAKGGTEWEKVDTSDSTADLGEYALEGLPAGTYRVEIEAGPGMYDFWNDAHSLEVADDIVVGTGVEVSGKDAQLVYHEHDAFVNNTVPTISGTLQVGSTLTVTGGTWTPTPATTTYEWYSGADLIAGANAATYVPTAADLGKNVSVEVGVQGKKNRPSTVSTANFGPILAAPVVTPPVVTPPVVTTPVETPTATPTVTPTPAPVPAAPVLTFSKKITVKGALTVGSTLKLKNFEAVVSRAAVTYKIQWYAGSKKIKKATRSRLKVTKALNGKKLSVKVTAVSGTTTRTITVKVGKIR